MRQFQFLLFQCGAKFRGGGFLGSHSAKLRAKAHNNEKRGTRPASIYGTIQKETILKEDLICPICYENPVEIQTNCKHNYCKPCIEKNNNLENLCPYCRTQLEYFYEII